MKLGIIGAMEVEVKSLVEKLADSKVVTVGNLNFYEGRLFDKEVVIVKCGVGKVNSAICAQILISQFAVTHLLNTGIAGAMSKELKIFDFVVSTKTVYHDIDVRIFGYELGQIPGLETQFIADEKLISLVKSAFENSSLQNKHSLVTGLIASGDQFIAGGEKKEFIKNNFAPACVEMEGCAIAHTATVNKIPFVIIRCMSDNADDNVETVYNFNEDTAADICATLILEVVKSM